jgi:hypothetical protein
VNGRLFVAALAGLPSLLLFGLAFYGGGRTESIPFYIHEPASDLARDLNRGRGALPDWGVTKATAFHRALIVEVDAAQVGDAMAIALIIVTPVRSQYDEILVYVRRGSRVSQAAARRVQWTERGGFVELDLAALP